VAAVIAAAAAVYAARLQRRSGKEAAQAAARSAAAAQRSADAADRAVAAGRLGAEELELRSRREEVMRNLRWAAELAVSKDTARALMGTRQLHALGRSPLLDADGQQFVDEALAAVVEEPVQAVSRAAPDVAVFEVPTEVGGDDVALPGDSPASGGEGQR
jgi:hypothetical protein